ncbi:MAG: hypothetical protein N3B13_01140 [Deltaproteobacteria bacterium]|nr:hypothetical protein [Deltaproteobacteria bacterium]
MYKFEFYYLPGKYLNYSDFGKFVSEIRTIASYEGISVETPAREFFNNKSVVIARKNGRAVSYRKAELIYVPRSIPILFVYDSVSTPAVFKKDISYDMLYFLVSNLVLRFRMFENTYVCCINDNFFDTQRFESDFLNVFPSITLSGGTNPSYINVLEYLISNRMEIFGILDPTEIDRHTYFINNERLIQIGKTNTIKCISNWFRGRPYRKSGRQILTPDNKANAA